MKEERKNSMILSKGPQSRALQHFFFSQRQCAKIPGIDKSIKGLDIKLVGIIGCGTMGGGILMCFIEAGIPVIVLEQKQEYLDKGLNVVKSNWMRQVKKGRLSMNKYKEYISSKLLKPTLNYNDLSNVDIVIEAVFENLEIKQKVFRKLDGICKPQCILASNTSYIPIDKIALATNRPNKCIGCHFFAPANKMRLLENVRFDGGADDLTCITVQKMAKLIKKCGVLVKSCPGFVGNRMYAMKGKQVRQLLLEGATPKQVDNVCVNKVGDKMGIFQVWDLSGLDIGYPQRLKGKKEKDYTIADILVKKYNRRGMKNGKGMYDYPGIKNGDRTPKESKIVHDVIIKMSERKGIQRRDISDQEIMERMYFPLINEGYKILEEGIAIRPSDIDIVYIFGYGFPEYRGGPLYWIENEIGLKYLYQRLNIYQKRYPNVDGDYFKPANLLKECVENGFTSFEKFWKLKMKGNIQKSKL